MAASADTVVALVLIVLSCASLLAVPVCIKIDDIRKTRKRR